jgi:hypothetical protein
MTLQVGINQGKGLFISYFILLGILPDPLRSTILKKRKSYLKAICAKAKK